MRSLGLAWAAHWAALAVLVASKPAPIRHGPDSADVLLERSARKSLRAAPGRTQETAPEKVISLERRVAGLEADKKGLAIALRRLLKGNQTESQKKMLNALRSAKLEAQAAAKKLLDTELADKAKLEKMQKLQQGTEEKLVQEMSKFRGLQEKEKSEEAALAAIHKSSEGVSSKQKQLETETLKLKEQTRKLQEEKRGLEATVQKLWTVNASAGAKTMLKMLGAEDQRLKVVDHTRQAEENQFAQEKSELLRKLSEAENRHEVDVQTVKALQGNISQLQAQLKEKDALQAKSKAAEALRERGMLKKQEAMLAQEKQKEADTLKAAHDTEHALQAKIDKEVALNQQLTKANGALKVESETRRAEVEKLKSDKEADDNVYAQALTDLQQKLNKSEALVREKDQEIKEVSARGMETYAKSWAKIQKTLEDRLAKEEKEKHVLEAQLADLSLAEKQRASELAKLSEAGSRMRELLKQDKQKLEYALDKENSEMARGDKLEVDNKALSAALEKEKELEPKLLKLEKETEALREADRIRQAQEKQLAEEKSDLLRKLSEAENKHQTDVETASSLRGDNGQLAADSLQARSTLKKQEAMLAKEKQKEADAVRAAQESQRALQAKVEKEAILNDQLEKANAQLAQESEQKNVEAETHRKEEDLQRKNDQLQETIVSMVAKVRNEETLQQKNEEMQETIASMAAKIREMDVLQKLEVTPKVPFKVDVKETPVSKEVKPPNELEKAKSDLSKLVSELRNSTESTETTRRPELSLLDEWAEADDA